MTLALTHLNGNPATSAELAPLVFAGYAHFTAMQIRHHSIRGLDLHLERLRSASDELFGLHLSNLQITEYLRSAVASTGAPDMSLTCFVTSRPGEFAPVGDTPQFDVLIKVTDPAQPPAGPLSLDLVEHERHLARVKHVGEVGKTFFLRKANARGFDDAAFVDRQGRLSEATIWNLAFWDGESVIWPRSEYLAGVTMQILKRGLQRMGVPQLHREVYSADITEQISAVVMNSWTPGVPVSHLGSVPLAQDPTFLRALSEAYDSEIATKL
jgi:branched-subunit amino acid aminotransferase/4-amino-4-deoxychorismate lyase